MKPGPLSFSYPINPSSQPPWLEPWAPPVDGLHVVRVALERWLPHESFGCRLRVLPALHILGSRSGLPVGSMPSPPIHQPRTVPRPDDVRRELPSGGSLGWWGRIRHTGP
jgi:hypothetical protein